VLIEFTIRSPSTANLGARKQRWAQRRNITLAYIQPGKPWQNGFAESFVGTYRMEVLNAEVFHSINESDVVSRSWLHMYNHERPHSKHNYLPPVSKH
jgi:transposase InsO family protein